MCKSRLDHCVGECMIMYIVKVEGMLEEMNDLNLLSSRSESLVWPSIKWATARQSPENGKPCTVDSNLPSGLGLNRSLSWRTTDGGSSCPN